MSLFTPEELAKAKRISALFPATEKRASRLNAASDAFLGEHPYVPNFDLPHIPSPQVPISYTPNGLFGSNPRQFSQAWDLVGPQTYSWGAPPARMTFGQSLNIARRGVGHGIGNFAQMAVTGHDGGNSIGMNLFGDAMNTLRGHPPTMHSLGQSFSGPWQRAMHGGPTGGLSEAGRMAGMPGEWLRGSVVPAYQFGKSLLLNDSPK